MPVDNPFDILESNLQNVLLEVMMERLNLNVPKETRAALRRLAQGTGRKEAEVARQLLVAAVEQQEREEFHRAALSAQRPALRGRLREIASAMEKLRGEG